MSRKIGAVARLVALLAATMLFASACGVDHSDVALTPNADYVAERLALATDARELAQFEARQEERALESALSARASTRAALAAAQEELALAEMNLLTAQRALENTRFATLAVPADATAEAVPVPESNDVVVFRRVDRNDERDLFTLDVATGRVHAITEAGDGRSVGPGFLVSNDGVAVSPDGERIAYSLTDGDFRSDIIVANLDGSDPEVVGIRRGEPAAVLWTPDGNLIFDDINGGRRVISHLDMTTGDQELLLFSEGDGVNLVGMSGEHFVFVDRDRPTKLVRFDLQTRERFDDITIGFSDSIRLSPSGSQVVVMVPTGEGERLGIVDLIGAEMRGWVAGEIPEGLAGARFLSDDRTLAFVTGPDEQDDLRLMVADLADGFEPRSLFTGWAEVFAVGPSDTIYITARVDDQWELHMVTLDGEVTPLGIDGWPVAVLSG